MHYILRTESGEFVDAETVADLSSSRLSAALTAVDMSEEKTYGDVLYTRDLTGLLNYGSRFLLLLTDPVRERDFAAFKSALITIWEQTRHGMHIFSEFYNFGNYFKIHN